METSQPTAPVPVPEPLPDSSGYRYPLLVFAFAFLFSGLVIYVSLVLDYAYGFQTVSNALQSSSGYFTWIYRGIDVVFFLVFYRLGKMVDLVRGYALLGGMILLGVLIGTFPDLLNFTTNGANETISGLSLNTDPNYIMEVVIAIVEGATIPFAGLALAFGLKHQRMLPAQPAGVETGRLSSQARLFLVAFPVVFFSFLILGLAAVALEHAFGYAAAVSQYANYPVYFSWLLYPLIFFVALYFVGRRMDGRGNLLVISLTLFLAGALGYATGVPASYYVGNLYRLSGFTAQSLTLDYAFFENVLFQGLFTWFFGFAAASLGFIRKLDSASRGSTSDADDEWDDDDDDDDDYLDEEQAQENDVADIDGRVQETPSSSVLGGGRA